MTSAPGPVASADRSRRGRVLWILLLYLLTAAIYTRPLLEQSTTRIANDPYDPILNASILWWNATTVPFSSEWWTGSPTQSKPPIRRSPNRKWNMRDHRLNGHTVQLSHQT